MLSAYTDSHVHVEHFEVGGCAATRDLLELHRKKGVTDLSLLSYMPGCDIVSNLNVLWWKKHYNGMRLRSVGTPIKEVNEGLMLQSARQMLSDWGEMPSRQSSARWLRGQFLL